jgi:hypothetical protein
VFASTASASSRALRSCASSCAGTGGVARNNRSAMRSRAAECAKQASRDVCTRVRGMLHVCARVRAPAAPPPASRRPPCASPQPLVRCFASRAQLSPWWQRRAPRRNARRRARVCASSCCDTRRGERRTRRVICPPCRPLKDLGLSAGRLWR